MVCTDRQHLVASCHLPTAVSRPLGSDGGDHNALKTMLLYTSYGDT